MPCHWVFDAHVHKNGGTSLRNWFLRHEMAGSCVYSGYVQPPLHLVRSELLLARNRTHFREIHLGPPISDVISVARQVQSVHPRSPACKVVSILRLRRPSDFYASFYRWGFAYKRTPPPFANWSRQYPNIQSNILLEPNYALSAERNDRRPDRASWSRVVSVLKAVDYAVPTEKLDHLVVLLSKRTGLPLLPYARRSPRSSERFRGCCTEAAQAPIDERAYRWAKRRFRFPRRYQPELEAFQRLVRDYSTAGTTQPRELTCRYKPQYDRPLRFAPDNASEFAKMVVRHRTFDCPWPVS